MADSQTVGRSWSVGDRVVHPGKPEWGVGSVQEVTADSARKPGAQRLTIRFERAGVKTLSTAFASLRSADGDRVPLGAPETEEEAGHLEALIEDCRSKLVRVPDRCLEESRPVAERLRESVRLGSFGTEGAAILDWAASVTELPDPLAHFPRHELEVARQRFQREISSHAQSLVRELVRSAPDELRAIAGSLSAQERAWLLGLVAKAGSKR